MILITMLYAGVAVFLNFTESVEDLSRESGFDDIFEASQSLYIATSLSNFPGVLKPFVESSKYFLIYFLPFVVFTVLIFLPIPVAVVFEAFRVNRSKIHLEDRLAEKEALFLSFVCLDHK